MSSLQNSLNLNSVSLSEWINIALPGVQEQTVVVNKPITKIYDPSLYLYESCCVFGTNQSYVDSINTQEISWSQTPLGISDSSENSTSPLEELFSSHMYCIISENLAQELLINSVGEHIVLSVTINNTANLYTFTVCGIALGLPAFNNFYSDSPFNNAIPGVLLNLDDYLTIMGYTGINDPSLPIDTILVNLENTQSNAIDIFEQNVIDPLENEYSINYVTTLQNQYSMEQGNQAILQYQILMVSLFLAGIALIYFISAEKGSKEREYSVFKNLGRYLVINGFAFILGLIFTILPIGLLTFVLNIPALWELNWLFSGLLILIFSLLFTGLTFFKKQKTRDKSDSE